MRVSLYSLATVLMVNIGAPARGLADPINVARAQVAAPAVDSDTGLVKAENWELVRANCTACHAASLVTQQRASRSTWLEMIRWMQATQNLWQFDVATEARILDYLAAYYPPNSSSRRMPLTRSLRPPNPYAPTVSHSAGEIAAPQ